MFIYGVQSDKGQDKEVKKKKKVTLYNERKETSEVPTIAQYQECKSAKYSNRMKIRDA